MLLAEVPLKARCQSWAAALEDLAVSGNHRDAKTFQLARRLPGLIQVSTVIAPGVRAVPAGKTVASPVPSMVRLAPVESLTRAVLPKKLDVAVEEAGLTLFQPVGADAANEEVLLASRFKTRLLLTIAALAGVGMSR
jgi:hypothetical protein